MPHRGTSNEYPQHMFLWRNKKNINTFQRKILSDLEGWYLESIIAFSAAHKVKYVIDIIELYILFD